MTDFASDSKPYDGSMKAVLSTGARLAPAGALSASLIFGWRALLKIKHVPMQLFDVTMFPIMFTLMFTYLFGGALAGSTNAYLQYLLPGILVQTVVFITMYTGMALNLDVSKGVFDRFRSLPIWKPAPLVGALLGDLVRYSIAGMIVMLLGLVLGFRPHGGLPGMLLAWVLVLAFSFSISWIWTWLGLILKSQESIMMTSSMILFFLTFASNIFVDPKTMPGLLQAFVGFNPITHAATAVRALMEGTLAVKAIAWVAFDSVLIVAVFGPLTMREYNRPR